MESGTTMRPIMAHRAQTKAERQGNAVLGQRLAKLRKERGFTQVELAKQLALSQAIVSNYERGRVRPHPEFLLKLAQLLDVSTDELLGRTSPHKAKAPRANLDRRFARRLQLVGSLPKRDQDALLRTIDVFLTARTAVKAS